MRRIFFTGIGAGAALLLALLLLLAWSREQGDGAGEEKEEKQTVRLIFQSKELVYDGSGALDLMEGVTAKDDRGNDLTDRVDALITAEGGIGRKKIRYTVFSSEGEKATGERTLVLEDYQGPKIEAASPLDLQAEDLPDLIPLLKERGQLRGTDGFGMDITDQVAWQRRKLSKGVYEITFSLDNAYLDHAQETVQARISGEVQDLTLALREDRIEIPAGSEFYPLDYLKEAQDPSFGSIADRVQVSSTVNTAKPGNYTAVYALTSVDGTQRAEAVLEVTVTGGAG